MSDASLDNDVCVPPTPEVVERLVAGHRAFLSFLESRVANRAIAEEILQSAFVRTLEKGGGIEDSENAVAWFYRVLRNSVTDYYRRRASEGRSIEAQASEPRPPTELELRNAVCECMRTLLPTLKTEYADVIRRVDLDEEPMARVASDLQISANNATVRLHRARQALKRQLERSCGTCATHGCLDCTCGGR